MNNLDSSKVDPLLLRWMIGRKTEQRVDAKLSQVRTDSLNRLADKFVKTDDVFEKALIFNSLLFAQILPGSSTEIEVSIATAGILTLAQKPIAIALGKVDKYASGVIRKIKLKNTNNLNPLNNTVYSPKVIRQRGQKDFHDFPDSVDAFAGDGSKRIITGGDRVKRTEITLPGNYKGKDGKFKEGQFEWIIEPDGETINHRLFRPKK